MVHIEKMMSEHIEECVDLFIDVFTREPWNDVYDSREQVVQFFENHIANNYFVGYIMLVDVAADGIHHMTADRAMNVVATIRSLAVGCPGVEPIVVQYDLSQIQFVGLCHSLFVRGEEHRNFFSAISIAINQRMILVFRHAASHYRIGLSSRSRYLSFQNSIASS